MHALLNDPARLWYSAGMPAEWIAFDADARRLVMFPARVGGWADRRPYRGHPAALHQSCALNAIGTGWPHSRPGVAQEAHS